MLQTSQTLVIAASPEPIWVLLNDMIARPERYESDVVLKSITPGNAQTRRLVSRDGRRFEEILNVNRDALMVELTVPSDTDMPHLSIIHQVVPSGEKTILNLAATWPDHTLSTICEELEDKAQSSNTPAEHRVPQQAMNLRLTRLGNKIKQMAEALAK